MNYSIQDNIDFYLELNKNEDESKVNDTSCMLTHEPLIENYITLPCKHTFNYIPLYKEVCTKLTVNTYDSDKLHNNEIRCPYCRTKYDKLLPYINYEGVDKIHGVNWPEKDCMKHMECSWICKTGKNKGQRCVKNAYIKGDECYCYLHWITVNKKKNLTVANIEQKHSDIKPPPDEIPWTNEMETLCNSTHIIGLKKMLREKGLLLTGTKKILVKRLIHATKKS